MPWFLPQWEDPLKWMTVIKGEKIIAWWFNPRNSDSIRYPFKIRKKISNIEGFLLPIFLLSQ
jgi:hypothetical protein